MEHDADEVFSDWFYEGRVVDTLVTHLREEGWSIGRVPAAETRERGVDITAERQGEILLIEAKGFPSTLFADPKRRGETKRTIPTNQAQQWYSHALLKVLRLQTKHPKATVAMAFPSFPRYRTLFDETAPQLGQLGVHVYFVHESGAVEKVGCP